MATQANTFQPSDRVLARMAQYAAGTEFAALRVMGAKVVNGVFTVENKGAAALYRAYQAVFGGTLPVNPGDLRKAEGTTQPLNEAHLALASYLKEQGYTA